MTISILAHARGLDIDLHNMLVRVSKIEYVYTCSQDKSFWYYCIALTLV